MHMNHALYDDERRFCRCHWHEFRSAVPQEFQSASGAGLPEALPQAEQWQFTEAQRNISHTSGWVYPRDGGTREEREKLDMLRSRSRSGSRNPRKSAAAAADFWGR